MYVKFNEDGTYGFYTPSIHGEEILEDESYLKISQELYNEAMEFSGIKILTPELILIDSPIEKGEESPSEVFESILRRNQVEIVLNRATAEEAVILKELHDWWEAGVLYPKGKRVKHKVGELVRLYEVIEEHTSQADWLPEVVKARYNDLEGKIPVDDEGNPTGEIPPWVQPRGSHDAYHLGDKVTDEGVTWECTRVDSGGNNTWKPGVFGWDKIQ